MRKPWTKNFRAIPRDVHSKLGLIDDQLIRVAGSKKITAHDIEAGIYSHIGLSFDAEGLSFVQSQLPDAANGRFSDKNRNGWEVKRTDLPKITKTYTWESPNFGDPSKGYHTQSRDRLVYQKQYFEPLMFKLVIELVASPVGEGGTYYLKFSIDQTLDRNSSTFEDRLFFALNLIRENTGVYGVYPSDVSVEDFQRSIFVDWEIFPEGTANEVVDAISRKNANLTAEKKAILLDRINMFNAMRSSRIMIGTGGFGSYIGAEFADDLVVFENTNYGNALYILLEDWETTSQKPRTELLRGTNENYIRITHKRGWERVFKAAMANELKKRGIRVSKQGRFF
jgi:hypothetical protein